MNPKPFENCPALDGCHCQTSSFRKIFHFNNCPLSEEMILGIGAGMGFIYWHQKGTVPFIGARGNYKDFCKDIGRRTGVKISNFRKPAKSEIYESLHQAAGAMLHAPISNMGIRGIRKTRKMIKKWPEMLDEKTLWEALFNVYIFIESGGTGGGSFRYMYSRYLKEAADITGNKTLNAVSEMINSSGEKLSEFAAPFKNSMAGKINMDMINRAPEIMNEIADIEEEAFVLLEQI